MSSTPLSVEPTGKARRLGRILAIASLLLALLLPVAMVLAWLLNEPGRFLAAAGGKAPVTPEPWQTFLAVALSLAPVLMISAALLKAHRYFASFARGAYFAGSAVRALHAIGQWLIAAGVVGLILPTLLGLILTATAPAGGRMLIVNISSTALLTILFGGLVWAVAKVMKEASSIAADHAEIV